MDALNTEEPLIQGSGTSAAAWRASRRLNGVQRVSAMSLVPWSRRAVVVAPHPDDEVLGTGSLLGELERHGIPALLIAVTDGEASHPASGLWSRERLSHARPRETEAALAELKAGSTEVRRLVFPDGQLTSCREALCTALRVQLQTGDVVFSTWRGDGHPDHEVVGQACAELARHLRFTHIEFPVWAWHWAQPDDPALPWNSAVRLRAGPDAVSRKLRALNCFRSQTSTDTSTGADPVLTRATLLRTVQVGEVFFR